MTGSLGRVTGRESGRVGGVGTVQENEGFGSHPAVTTKPSFSLHASRVTRLKGGCAPKIPRFCLLKQGKIFQNGECVAKLYVYVSFVRASGSARG